MSMKKIPVTIVTGFLGAGKTTLVNHLLDTLDKTHTAVIVNEYGEVGVDGALIHADDQILLEIRNGCVCCTVRTDLVAGVRSLLQRSPGIERIIVETSGLADPGPVLQSFLAEAELLQQVQLESVITVVDAVNLARLGEDQIAQEQIAFSDLIVMNKMDLVDAPQLEQAYRQIRAINPVAVIIESSRARIAPALAIGQQRFSLPRALEIEPGLLADEHDHEHDSSIGSCSIQCSEPIEAAAFNRWFNGLVNTSGEQLMRTKAILQLQGEARQFHVHSVHMLTDARPGKPWPREQPPQSTFVAIGRGLDHDRLRTGFLACRAMA